MKALATIIICLFWVIVFGQESRLITVSRTIPLMGVDFNITVVSADEEIGYINIEEIAEEIRRIESLINPSDENSELAKINRNAGIAPVKVSSELYTLIERAKQVSEITGGAFDISSAVLQEVWKFDGSMSYIPSSEEISKLVSLVGNQKIVLDASESTIFLMEKGMKINFDSFGKGYAMDKAKELIASKGVQAGVIDAAGKLITWGTRATGEKWLLGIANPLSADTIFSWMPVEESAAVTSGNLEEFITFKGLKYSSIIDPRTGFPSTGVKSVSVFAKSAELCDALSTAVHVLGIDAGLSLINQLEGTEAIIIDNDNIMHKSKGIQFSNTP